MEDAWGTASAANTAEGDAFGTAAPADNAAGDAWGSGAETGDTANTDITQGKKYEKIDLSKEEFLSKARDAGWTEKTAFNYDEYMRTGGEDRDWHGAAKVYEWKDEFGDVGPEVPELEKILFGGEFQMRKGAHTEHLDLEVNIEGPVKIAPVLKVR